MYKLASLTKCMVALIAACFASSAMGQKEIVLGLQCDRTGAAQVVGVNLCPGYHDYVALVNASGGVEGRKLKVIEIDHEYKVTLAVESYERHKKEGAVIIGLLGTPQTQALMQRLNEDRMPATAPGFGPALAADGAKHPYVFPIAATFWSQAAGAVHFIKQQLNGSYGSLMGRKIAYLFFDNPAGREPLPVLEDLARLEGFQLKGFAVPPPGVEMGAQVLDIAQRFRPDFVISNLFGRSPSVSIKALKRAGYPLSRVISLGWGASEADIEAAGGWGIAEGYYGTQFHGVGEYPVRKGIADMYRSQGKAPPTEMAATVFYNRGIMAAAVSVEAIRHALKAKKGGDITPADVKLGMEKVKGFTLDGLVPPLEITPTDHEGGGWVQVFQARGGKWVKATDWLRAYPEVIRKHMAK